MGRPTRVARSKESEENVERGLCAWCGKPRPKGKRVYCSVACFIEYWDHHDWGWMRTKILGRDKFTCAKCGFQVTSNQQDGFYKVLNDPNGFSKNDRHLWDKGYYYVPLVVDHIKPVALFPKLEYDESNLQVLCKWCNKVKTKHDIQKISRMKRTTIPVCDSNDFEVGLRVFYESLKFEQKQLT